MEHIAIELLDTIKIEKPNFSPISFDTGTIFKVIMPTLTGLLVRADNGFTFTVSTAQENIKWRAV